MRVYLEQLRLECYLSILCPSMAFTTQANEICQVISFNVADKGEKAKRLDVMHIKFFAKFLFGFAAMLASIGIAFAHRVSLLIPIWAVVVETATLPLRMILSRFVGGVPHPHALGITKVAFAMICKPLADNKISAALLADTINYIGIMAVCVPLTLAHSIAKVFVEGFNNIRVTKKWLSTLGTRNFNFCLLIVAACHRTVMIFVSSDNPWRSKKYRSAAIARNFDSITAHKKYLLLVVDRVLVEDIRTLTRGMANNSRLHASGQQIYVLDRCIVPHFQGAG